MELLRIVAMYMILVYHTVYYVFYNYRGESPIFASMMVVLHIGVPLFVLISGYFGIKPSVKGFLKLYLILLFYNLFFYLLRCSLLDVQFSYKTFAKLCLPFSIGGRWWFFKVYLMLYFFAPILDYIKDRTGGKKVLIISGFITFYWGWFAHHPSLFDGKNLVNFTYLYMLGHWLRTKVDELGDRNKGMRIKYIIAYLVLSGCIGFALYFSNERIYDIIKRLCYGYNSPILILMSVLFFMVFTTFEFKSKIVNCIAGSVFAVYCVHEGQYFFRDEWYGFFEEQYLTNIKLFPIVLVVACMVLFVLCILLDKVRLLFVGPILNPVETLIKKSMSFCDRKTLFLRKRI